MGLFRITYETLNDDDTEAVYVSADSIQEAIEITDNHTKESSTQGEPFPILKVEMLKEKHI